ncbi:hypothetical protein [Rhodococcus triatomae]|nr:hypothetical protein G419_25312 [Rhodococcus triatomae BKS 15-14]
MPQLIVYPLVESVVISYLRPFVGTTKIATKVPDSRPDRLIRVTAAGGSGGTVVTSSRLVIVECWDKLAPDAADLAELSFAALIAGARDHNEPRIRDVRVVSAPQSFPDPLTNAPRYQFTLSVTLRGQVRN